MLGEGGNRQSLVFSLCKESVTTLFVVEKSPLVDFGECLFFGKAIEVVSNDLAVKFCCIERMPRASVATEGEGRTSSCPFK